MIVDYNYKKIAELFHSIEMKYNLLYQKIDNVFFWQISRVNIYLEIMDCIVSGNNPVNKTFNRFNIRIIIYRLFNFLLRNPFFSLKKKNILVFDSGRKYKVDNRFIDIYTSYLCEDFEIKGVNFEKYETNINHIGGLSNNSLRIKHIDFINISSFIMRFFFKTNISEKDLCLIEDIQSEINNVINVNIDIPSIVKRDITIYKSQYSFYKLLFKIKAPKEIFIINSCDKPFLISAAKQQKIIVNELQHGLISNYDIICNFPNIAPNSLDYFPNRFFIWKNINMCFASLPLSPDNIIYFNNKHIEKCLKTTEKIEKEKRTILIISQPYGSVEILQFIERSLYQMSNYKFIYKIHPAEDQNKLKEKINRIKEKYNNIVFENDSISIYSLLKKAEFVIGVFSSALFEAEVFQCKIMLLDLPGVEMAFPLLKNQTNKLLKTTDNLLDNLIF